jgi:DNA (cytosine-5)-methyltransferase 1
MLVLSLFPGIGLLDMAFELEGFTVVRGPDVLWGGDIRRFHPPAGKFDGVIGGPPCQAHSRYAGINRAMGNSIAEDLVPDFLRVVDCTQPTWFLMENVPGCPSVDVAGYSVHCLLLDNRWLGERQSRKRKFQFGTRTGAKLLPEVAVFDSPQWEPAVLATEGKAGRMTNRHVNGKQKTFYNPRRPWGEVCGLQGLPADFLDDSPFTMAGKYRVVGNGVPLPMGRAIARAVKEAMQFVP